MKGAGLNLFNHVLEKYVDGEQEISDYITIFILREIVDLVDGLIALTTSSCVKQMNKLTRVLFEYYVYLLFIYKDKNQKECRAAAYLVAYILQKGSRLELLGNGESCLVEDHEKLLSSLRNQDQQKKFSTNLAEYVHRFSNYPEFCKLYEKYSMIKKQDFHKWYQLTGLPINNFRSLAKEVKQEGLYITIYSILSSDIHGTEAPNSGHFLNGVLHINCFKDYGGLDSLLHIINFIIFESLGIIESRESDSRLMYSSVRKPLIDASNQIRRSERFSPQFTNLLRIGKSS